MQKRVLEESPVRDPWCLESSESEACASTLPGLISPEPRGSLEVPGQAAEGFAPAGRQSQLFQALGESCGKTVTKEAIKNPD